MINTFPRCAIPFSPYFAKKVVPVAKNIDGVDLYYPKDMAAWRSWLQKNHLKKKSVWLVYYKPASGKTRVSYNDAVDEAICFGWIDSKPNKLDALRTIQFFARRNPASSWSRINKARVDRLTGEGRMTNAGLEVVKQAKQTGGWDALNDVEAIIIPADFGRALQRNKKASTYFTAFPRSSKKIILGWIHTAKRAETRNNRIKEAVQMAAKNIRANHYRQPKSAGGSTTARKKPEKEKEKFG